MITSVLAGEGVGWLKLNRLKKLMEDENYRDLVVTKLNKSLNRKISPDDHIDDVVNFLEYLKCRRIPHTQTYIEFEFMIFEFFLFFILGDIETRVQGNVKVPSSSNAWSRTYIQ